VRQIWQVTGTILVDAAPPGGAAAGRPPRPLAGAAVAVTGWPDERACTALWGELRTGRDGTFHLRAAQPAWAHEIGVAVRVAPGRWLRVFASRTPLDGPVVETGALLLPAAAPAAQRLHPARRRRPRRLAVHR
jgi:hypothetical protein